MFGEKSPRVTNRRIRVCIVAPSMAIAGGQSIQASLLERRLRQIDRFDVLFIEVNPRLSGVVGRLQRIRYVRTILTTVAYLWSLCRTIPRVDVVHTFSASYFSYLLAPFPAILIARLFGRAVLLNYHSGEADDHLGNWPLSRASMRLATRIVVPSEYLAEVFGRYGLSAVVVPNFIELGSIRWRARRLLRPCFFTNRGFETHYNVANVLRAYARIEREHSDAELTVAGDGPLRAQLESLVSTLGARHVRFVGRVDPATMAALYDEADIFLNGSSIDNMPLSILECHAAGLPVVSTAAGGIPLIVKNGETGLLTPLDDPEALATTALSLLDNPGLAEHLSTQGRLTCQSYHVWEAVQPLWERHYRELANVRLAHQSDEKEVPSIVWEAPHTRSER